MTETRNTIEYETFESVQSDELQTSHELQLLQWHKLEYNKQQHILQSANATLIFTF